MFILRFTHSKQWFILGKDRTQDIQISKEQLNKLFQGKPPRANEYYVDDVNLGDLGFNNKAYKMLSAGDIAAPSEPLPKHRRRFNKKLLIGLSVFIGIIVILAIVGSLMPSDTSQHISENTGLSKDQANAIEKEAQKNLASFLEVGNSYIKNGESVLNSAQSIDCANYSYKFENAGIRCQTGKSEQQAMGNDEVTLGNCYKNLSQDGSYTTANIQQCITNIDSVIGDWNMTIVNYMYDSSTITSQKNALAYNKATLQSAIDDLNNASY